MTDTTLRSGAVEEDQARRESPALARLLELAPSEEALAEVVKGLERERRAPTPPPVDGDFYDVAATFSKDEKRMQRVLRDFFAREVHPIINDYWDRGEFPREVVPKFGGLIEELFGPYRPDMSLKRSGVMSLELGRGDPSISTFSGSTGGSA